VLRLPRRILVDDGGPTGIWSPRHQARVKGHDISRQHGDPVARIDTAEDYAVLVRAVNST
jgi:hypothetical protein